MCSDKYVCVNVFYRLWFSVHVYVICLYNVHVYVTCLYNVCFICVLYMC